MNCKPGDLAVVVRSVVPANIGRFVTVVRAVGWLQAEESVRIEGRTFRASAPGFYWWLEADSPLLESGLLRPKTSGLAADDQLRPIRDPGHDARDETLDWLPVPQKEVA